MGKKAKHPCEGCIWKLWTGDEKVVCMFPKCHRAEYERIWLKRRSEAHERKEQDS